MARAMVRGYPVTDKSRAGQVKRIHIIREDTPSGLRQTWCGQGTGAHKNSQPLIFDPMPATAPEGLSWCPMCIGHLAELCGLLNEVAKLLAAATGGDNMVASGVEQLGSSPGS